MEEQIEIKVYCGKTIEDMCHSQLHPLNEVKLAQSIIELNKSTITYSNCPDFVSSMKYICEKKGIKVEFFLDGKSLGDDINPIFEDFNKSFDYLSELLDEK